MCDVKRQLYTRGSFVRRILVAWSAKPWIPSTSNVRSAHLFYHTRSIWSLPEYALKAEVGCVGGYNISSGRQRGICNTECVVGQPHSRPLVLYIRLLYATLNLSSSYNGTRHSLSREQYLQRESKSM